MIAIVDYGIGNLGSIQNMFKKIGIESQIVDQPEKVQKAQKIVLPGVGAFDAAINKLNASGLRTILEEKALKEKVPFLGICLGMQLLSRGSEEGKCEGLGWIDAFTYKFSFNDQKLKVPHMNWNEIRPVRTSTLLNGLEEEAFFYFSHSYFVQARQEEVLSITHYGVPFASAVCRENLYGVQFHPEKSHKYGMQLFKNFAML